MKILIIIPCFNEADNLTKVIENLKQHIDFNFDYIIINDCSSDQSLELCKQNQYNYIHLATNLGIGGCMQTGYLFAKNKNYDIAVQFDGDSQHDAAYIHRLVKPLLSNDVDITIGSRFLTNQGFQSTPLRRIGINFLSKLISIFTKIKIQDVTSGFRAVNKKYIDLFAKKYATDYPEPEAILDAVANGAKILEIPVIMHERSEGKSSIYGFRSIYYVIKVSLTIIMHKFVFQKIKK